MNKLIYLCIILPLLNVSTLEGQELAVLKYRGGGDWYSNPTALKNLITFCNTNLKTTLNKQPKTVEPNTLSIYEYPFIQMTGHGNVYFSDEDIINLRTYLLSGGFLHIDDNYGMKPYALKALKQLFPNKDLKEIPINHPIFNTPFKFDDGLPKIHKHDGLAPMAMGYFENNRLVLLFTYESDLSDGWEDKEVHNDPQELRLKALKMGANIVHYAFNN